MKRGYAFCIIMLLAVVLPAYGQLSVGGWRVVALSRDAVGELAVSSVWPQGCYNRVCYTDLVEVVRCTNVVVEVVRCRTNMVPILSCATNLVPVVRCFTNQLGQAVCWTNMMPRWQCTTNGFEEVVLCRTNTVSLPDCFTNVVTKLVCTNLFNADSAVRVVHTLNAALVSATDCDELGDRLPATATLRMTLHGTLRPGDWRGLQNGTFQVLVGTNVVASGRVAGAFGSSRLAAQDCLACDTFEGTLHGVGRWGSSWQGWRIQATYSGRVLETVCPSADVPQGKVELALEGVALTPCEPTILPQF